MRLQRCCGRLSDAAVSTSPQISGFGRVQADMGSPLLSSCIMLSVNDMIEPHESLVEGHPPRQLELLIASLHATKRMVAPGEQSDGVKTRVCTCSGQAGRQNVGLLTVGSKWDIPSEQTRERLC